MHGILTAGAIGKARTLMSRTRPSLQLAAAAAESSAKQWFVSRSPCLLRQRQHARRVHHVPRPRRIDYWIRDRRGGVHLLPWIPGTGSLAGPR
jgi:hypothetical protein